MSSGLRAYYQDLTEHEHRRDGQPVVLLAEGVRQGAGDGFGLQAGVGQFAFGLGHLELHVEEFALGDHAVAGQGSGIFEVAFHAVDDLLAHGDDLPGERQPEVTFDELRDQRVAGLVTLFDGGFLVDLRGAVRGVDLAAHPDREGHLAADEAEAPVLQGEEPVGIHHRVEQSLNSLQERRIGNDSATEDFAREVLDRGFQVVEVDADILFHVGIRAREVDLRHAQSDGGAALLLGGTLFVGGGFQGGVLREGHGNGLFERDHLSLLLSLLGRNRSCGHGRSQDDDREHFFHREDPKNGLFTKISKIGLGNKRKPLFSRRLRAGRHPDSVVV